MAYSKQNFQDGQILNAVNLEAMENGIIAGQGAHNLLDNSDFANPVNQRGKTSYGGGEYAIDRWKMQNDTNMNIMDGFIRITGSWDAQQILGNKLIGTYTYAIYAKVNVAGEYTQTIEIYENGSTIATSFCTAVGEWKIYTCTATFTGTNGTANPIVTINNRAGSVSDASIDVKWAALYEGSYDASTLPPYVPKGKHVEMLNCGVSLQPHNLLDNSDFANPVNQRGATSYSGVCYTIDRWRSWGESMQINVSNGGIIVSGGALYQYVLCEPSKTYTAAICLSDGTIICSSGVPSENGIGDYNTLWVDRSDDNLMFRIGFDAIEHKYVWAALYEGAYDASTLPAYQPKGYAAELEECRRYYVHCGEVNWMTGFYKVGEGLVVEIPAANNIRATYPTIIVNSPKVFTTNGWYDITYASCSVTKCWTKLLFNRPEEANQYLTNGGAHIITGIVGVSADL